VARYRGKLSGPLLDRIDLMIDVPAVTEAEITGRAEGEPSSVVRARTIAARQRQIDRQGKPNAALGPDEVERHCLPDCGGAALLKQALTRLDLSARAYHRILKVARTIADLSGEYIIRAPHVAEAIQYRRGLGG
jgi:magnesium chelatase family protein